MDFCLLDWKLGWSGQIWWFVSFQVPSLCQLTGPCRHICLGFEGQVGGWFLFSDHAPRKEKLEGEVKKNYSLTLQVLFMTITLNSLINSDPLKISKPLWVRNPTYIIRQVCWLISWPPGWWIICATFGEGLHPKTTPYAAPSSLRCFSPIEVNVQFHRIDSNFSSLLVLAF